MAVTIFFLFSLAVVAIGLIYVGFAIRHLWTEKNKKNSISGKA